MSDLYAVVLAAGHGKRMRSALPKVMHPIAGRPLVHYAIVAALDAGARRAVVVVGHERERVTPYLARTFGDRISIALQEQQNGTGHATQQALPVLPSNVDRVLILCGDTPLLRSSELAALAQTLESNDGCPLAMLTCRIDDPTGYGRILRDDQGNVVEIREHRDLRTEEERAIREVNPGVYCARVAFLRDALQALRPDNAQGELYLTDVVARAAASGGVRDVPGDAHSLIGVNDREQLARAEDLMHGRIISRLRKEGVTIRTGATIEDTVEIEPDATIEQGASLRGRTRVEARAHIDVGCVVVDSIIGQGASLEPYSVVTHSRIDADAQVGPFSHLRPDTSIGEGARVGNFVETKNTILRRGARASHLAYLGDGDIGEEATIGAGTIFCNDDGFQKHRTFIGARAFVGSDSQIVAPVRVGDGAYVATGTTVTQDVPAEALAIGRARQDNKTDYAPRLRSRLAAAAKIAGEGERGTKR
jgi:bifunctional UDP-N-acetylglucosamine pyrophosphorylase/glucosamine-1-phosphate N-acetyltransferase